MEIINFEDFKKIEIRIGKILEAEKVEGSDKLLRLVVSFGTKPVPEEEIIISEVKVEAVDPKPDIRQIVAGIAQFYAPEDLIGKECPFAYNLAPRTLRGLESQGMILCPSNENGPALLHPDKEVPPGSPIK